MKLPAVVVAVPSALLALALLAVLSNHDGSSPASPPVSSERLPDAGSMIRRALANMTNASLAVSEGSDGELVVEYEPADDGDCSTVSDILCEMGEDFSVLCELLEVEYDLVDAVNAGGLTVFAPPDEAFLKIDGYVEDSDSLVSQKVLLFHVAEGMHTSDDLLCKEKLEMMYGGESRTKCATNKNNGEKYKFQNGNGNTKNGIEAVIVYPDIMACDGSVVHVVDNVMLPNFIAKFDE